MCVCGTDLLGHVFISDLALCLLRQHLEVHDSGHDERCSHLPAEILAVHSHHQIRIRQKAHGVRAEISKTDVGILEGI